MNAALWLLLVLLAGVIGLSADSEKKTQTIDDQLDALRTNIKDLELTLEDLRIKLADLKPAAPEQDAETG